MPPDSDPTSRFDTAPPADMQLRQQQRRLARMKLWPLALLLLMAVLYGLTLGRAQAWAPWLHAFAEAAMVGALADWFAVTALFRHPLGIPIPHTAIIPHRKDQLGENLALFVAQNFLAPAAVAERLRDISLSATLASWLQKDPNRMAVRQQLGRAVAWLVHGWQQQDQRRFLARLAHNQFERTDLAAVLSQLVEWLVADGRHQQVFTQGLRHAVVLVHDHRETIRGKVQQESPWWLPGFVDDRIAQKMLDRVESLLLQMSLDEQHPVRKDFDALVAAWIYDLRNSPSTRSALRGLQTSLLDNPQLHEYLLQLWTDLVAGLTRDLGSAESPLSQEFDRLLVDFAAQVEADDQLRASLDAWLAEMVIATVEEYRHGLASLVSETVKRWDARDTAERVELAIGSDLQFIRINGTLVGGLIGLVLHALSQLV